ncbi:SDR family NAD(P)-dependent oxidoreductase [Sinorhizobium sp. RAC02]|uniref:SDR family NAD(P)-dependent oxidoreductase n=1 Tax=Sinorhizobium sp. RAC02 TaxID=1842534 RepID=UPI0008561A7B|nr:SDR family NAD(P)-dependent oxidoreductase [Sinorhizobium sp. RAC02]AOF93225.1 short chain dehydrogenase family protein [Sinorhizobium sp. RAC02]
MTLTTAFDRFQIGDHIVFDKTFDQSQFDAFSSLSGDRNPFHHDSAYAALQGSDPRTIVPLHMTLAPLSMIAGMVFPGEPSLYLGHEIRAAKPVHYGETLRYSARIESVNQSHHVLNLRVLALKGSAIVLDATMRVQARYADWEFNPLHPIRREEDATALITGGSGEIGQAIAVALARQGYRLLLQDRGPSARRDTLAALLEHEKASFEFVAADLASGTGRSALTHEIKAYRDLGLVVHAASAPVEASAETHVAIAFSALEAIAQAALPTMLARQSGAFVLLGTVAVETFPPGWEAYAGAKMMATQSLRSLDTANRPYGVTGHTLAPGYVATAFSEAYRGPEASALLPAEVASRLLTLLNDRKSLDRDMIIEPGRIERGRFGFVPAGSRVQSSASPAGGLQEGSATSLASAPNGGGSDTQLQRTVLAALKLPADYDLTGGGLGITPGWDSLRHIELLLTIENQYGVRFTSGEIDATHRLDQLTRLLQQKRQVQV